MTGSAAQIRHYTGPAIFSFGFRPFFLSGAVLAGVLPLLTALSFSGIASFEPAYGLIAYHGHEMVYGYLAAVVAGFILTAVPNWTGRLPVMGWRLTALFTLWVAGRVAILDADFVGVWIAAAVDVSFLIVMDIILWREVITGKNWRNAPVCALIAIFALGNIFWHFNIITNGGTMFGLRWGAAVIAVLIALIGGRIIPSFTRNWMSKNDRRPIEAPFGAVDKLSIGALTASMFAWLVAPTHGATALLMIVTGAIHLLRLSRWGGWRTTSEPLVTILHIGYLWLCASLFLIGASALYPAAMPLSTAMHALTAGAAGVMTLAVMTRATLGHTGRGLRADNAAIVIYALANLGAALRLLALLTPDHYNVVLILSGGAWGGAFMLFAIIYGRYLIAPKVSAAAQAKTL